MPKERDKISNTHFLFLEALCLHFFSQNAKSVTRYWGKYIAIWYEQEQGSVLTQACVERAGIW